VRKKYQRKQRKSNHKLQIVQGPESMVQVPLPIAEVWSELQTPVEEPTGQAGLQILRAILENVTGLDKLPAHAAQSVAGALRGTIGGVVLMIDGIHFGGQVLVVALGIAESG
jgi:hypothetical protein